MAVKELPLPNSRVALVNDDVWEWASRYRQHAHPYGYVARVFQRLSPSAPEWLRAAYDGLHDAVAGAYAGK